MTAGASGLYRSSAPSTAFEIRYAFSAASSLR
jgi:hypothetical protein